MSPRRSRLLHIGLVCLAAEARAESATAQVWDPADCAACARAESLIAAGDTAGALRLLRSVVAETQDARAGGELGLLLGRRLTRLGTDAEARGEAEALLGRALRVEPWRPRWAFGYGLILWKQGNHEEALRRTEAALSAASARSGGLEPELLAELHATRGRILEERILDRDVLASGDALDVDRPAPGVRLTDAVDLSLERLITTSAQERASEDVRQTMRRHLVNAFRLDPLVHTGTYVLLAEAARAGEWDTFVALARAYVDASGGAGWPLAFLGAGLWRSGDAPGAEAAFDAALRALDEAGRDVLEDVSGSVTPANEKEFLGGDRRSRVEWTRFLLRTSDPLFLTPINERKLEHFTRVALAEILYGEPVDGVRGTQSGQGRILVRYGEPDEVRRVMPIDAPYPDAKPRIAWHYDDLGASFLFQRRFGRRGGSPMPSSADYARRLRPVQPSTYDFRVEPLRHQLVRFQGDRPELVEVEVHALLPAGPPASALPGRAGLFFLPRTPRDELRRLESAVRIGADAPRRVTFQISTGAGSYVYAVEAMTDDEAIRARALETLGAAPFLDAQPGVSDILLADYIAEKQGVSGGGRKDLAVAPSADLCFDEGASIWVYFEIYRLSPDVGGAGRYRVTLDVAGAGGRSVVARVSGWVARALRRGRGPDERVSWERTVTPLAPRSPEWFEVRLEDGAKGVHRITITVADLVSGGTTSTQRVFAIDEESACEVLPGTP